MWWFVLGVICGFGLAIAIYYEVLCKMARDLDATEAAHNRAQEIIDSAKERAAKAREMYEAATEFLEDVRKLHQDQLEFSKDLFDYKCKKQATSIPVRRYQR